MFGSSVSAYSYSVAGRRWNRSCLYAGYFTHLRASKQRSRQVRNAAEEKRTLAPVLGLLIHCLFVASYPV